MSKVSLNTGKNLEILSNNGRFRLIAKMKVDYDAVNDVFGARDWIFKVVDLKINKNVNLQTNGVNVFEKSKYQYKKELLKVIELANCFSIAISEIKNKNGIKA
jgi:hypothetical protein